MIKYLKKIINFCILHLNQNRVHFSLIENPVSFSESLVQFQLLKRTITTME
ncbi:hypothetical protein JHK84_039288 [Glycine max]|nr:hypothetical protein JHK87_038849 [Glycine soja]KAG4962191.1 hypothetical protein JHK86_039059 [Glycine max]KAG5120948.1 hypothetical protein JHK84_039288 [Glycine max]